MSSEETVTLGLTICRLSSGYGTLSEQESNGAFPVRLVFVRAFVNSQIDFCFCKEE